MKLSLTKETLQLLDADQTPELAGAADRYSFQPFCPSHIATCGAGTRCRTFWMNCL